MSSIDTRHTAPAPLSTSWVDTQWIIEDEDGNLTFRHANVPLLEHEPTDDEKFSAIITNPFRFVGSSKSDYRRHLILSKRQEKLPDTEVAPWLSGDGFSSFLLDTRNMAKNLLIPVPFSTRAGDTSLAQNKHLKALTICIQELSARQSSKSVGSAVSRDEPQILPNLHNITLLLVDKKGRGTGASDPFSSLPTYGPTDVETRRDENAQKYGLTRDDGYLKGYGLTEVELDQQSDAFQEFHEALEAFRLQLVESRYQLRSASDLSHKDIQIAYARPRQDIARK